MRRLRVRSGILAVVAAVGSVGARAHAQALPAAPAPGVVAFADDGPVAAGRAPLSAAGVLRTFTIEKTVEVKSSVTARTGLGADAGETARLPKAHESLRTTIGIGYVQGADWGSEIGAGGSISNVQVQFDSLVTRGVRGVVFERGALTFADPDAGWRVEAGDVFSTLRGASRGARLAWKSFGRREPSLSIYGDRPGGLHQPTVVSYRDQLRIAGQTLADIEVASDKSYFARQNLSACGLDVELAYRYAPAPAPTRDRSIAAGLRVWRGVNVSASALRTDQNGQRRDWRQVAIHAPVTRYVDFTFDRMFAAANNTVNTMSGAMLGFGAGRLRLFHRYQWGASAVDAFGAATTVARQQSQSMASYSRGARFDVTLQLATEWTETGQARTWEELRTSVRLTRGTSLQVVTAVPDFLDKERLQVRLTQDLLRRYSIVAEYGRLSPFQSIVESGDRPRVKIMLQKRWDIATPAPGGAVRGRVLDQTAHAVTGARVRLGEYYTESDGDGGYAFSHVPRGAYELSLDDSLLPADYAWDGRAIPVSVVQSKRVDVDLIVAPLNAIHGRVYGDRHGNGRPDSGEGTAGVVVSLGDRVTTTSADGAYSFYNLPPGTYVVVLNLGQGGKLEPAGPTELTVALTDNRPVTDADFRVTPTVKPILWQERLK